MSRATKNRLAPGVTNLAVRIKDWNDLKGTDIDYKTKSIKGMHFHKPGSQKKSLSRRSGARHVCHHRGGRRCPMS